MNFYQNWIVYVQEKNRPNLNYNLYCLLSHWLTLKSLRYGLAGGTIRMGHARFLSINFHTMSETFE